MNTDLVQVSVTLIPGVKIPEAPTDKTVCWVSGEKYVPSYGTCGFLYMDRMTDTVETFTYCKTEDGECEFAYYDIIENDYDNKVALQIYKGDEERIRELVKAEFEHFDTTVEFIN